MTNLSKKLLVFAVLLLISFVSVNAADNRVKTPTKDKEKVTFKEAFTSKKMKKLQDSLLKLSGMIDSLQFRYDSLLLTTIEPIDIIEQESAKNDYLDEEMDINHNPDSLLAFWYTQRNLADRNESDLLNVDDTVWTSSVPDSVYIERLKSMNSFIQLPYNNTIRNYIVLYTEKLAKSGKIQNIVGLSKYYLPKFEEIMIQYDLPQELKAMAVIESAFNIRAVSRARAKGMWQFMYQTALKYDLTIDSYVDERFEPELACHAAAQYLKDSYRIFGDWSLAIASYNCGAGNVNKAIRRSGGKRDFWEIYPYLPKETRGYVPAFVAALYALEYYPLHNIEPTPVKMPAHVDTFHVHQNLHLAQISENIGIDMDLLRDLNPQYLHDIVPATATKPYVIKLPYNYSGAFIDKESEIYNYKDSVFFNPVKVNQIKAGTSAPASGEVVVHKVKSGETLGGIAKKYRTTVANLKNWNGLRGNTIRVGQRLRIYGKSAPKPSTSSPSTSSPSVSSSVPTGGSITYTVKSGDTLGGISSKYGVSISALKSWNGLSSNTIRVGQKLKIHGKGSNSSVSSSSSVSKVSTTSSDGYVMYTVQKGDNLWSIAQKFSGVSVADIQQLNGYSNNVKIYPGMKIKIKKQ